MAKNKTKLSDFKLGKHWAEISKVQFDFDGDKVDDVAMILTRTFEPVFYPTDNDYNSPDLRTSSFLVVWLSGKGKSKFLLPSGASFDEGTKQHMVELSTGRIGFVIETTMSTMESMGSWWSSTKREKWRFEKNNFRLIGRTAESMHRATQETNKEDENLLTGKKIETYDPGPDYDPDEKKPKTETTRGQPTKLYLTESGSCSESEEAVMKDEK